MYFTQTINAGIYGAIAAFLVCLTLILTKGLHGKLSFDSDTGVQKHHEAPTPRIGGIGLFVGFCVMALFSPSHIRTDLLPLLVASIPAFAAGLYEDLFKNVRPRTRLLFHFVSALILVVWFNQILRYTGWSVTDRIMTLTPVAVLVSTFCLAGITNAVNIIDGFNGLASGSTVIMSAGLSAIAWRIGDHDFAGIALGFGLMILGFMALNFPFGKIFLGDAGAYLAGFVIGAEALMICARNPGLSPWEPLLVIFYPVWEVAFSILRRLRRPGAHPGQPDSVHLHHLVSRSFAKPIARDLNLPRLKNPITGALMWTAPLFCALFGTLLAWHTGSAMIGMVLFILIYDAIYARVSLRKISQKRKPRGGTRLPTAQSGR